MQTEQITPILSSLITNTNISVLQLAQSHRVSLTFIKWFGCPMCSQDIAEVAKALPTFLKLNTIPIICCQEDAESAADFFKNAFPNDPLVQNLLFVSGINEKVQQVFGLKSASLGAHMKAMPKMIPLLIKGRKFELPSAKVVDPFVEFGLFLIDKGGKPLRNWEFKKLGERPDYGQYLVDMEKDVHCTMEDVEALMKMFPNVTKTIVKNAKHQSLGMEAQGFNLEQVMQNTSKRNVFKMFLVNEHSVENIMFVEQVEKYRVMQDTTMRTTLANKIISNFLTEASFMEINTNLFAKNKAIQLLQEKGPEVHIFDSIEKELYVTVLSDSFSRFIKSNLYNKMCLQKRKSWQNGFGLFNDTK